MMLKGESMNNVSRFFVVSSLIFLGGCVSAAAHREAVQDNTPNSLTVGKVQREIKIGMSSAQVAETLGSPNLVTTDEQRREVWVYDKIASEAAYSNSNVFSG